MFPAGCGTDAVGVEDCRDIEQARCEAGAACGLVSDVDACKRFYRDHCLHGLALEEAPPKATIKRCAQTIQEIGACVKQLGPAAAFSDCHLDVLASSNKACELVSAPEKTSSCAFLVPDLPPPVPDSGSEAG